VLLWQLGTNSVIRDDKLGDHGTSIRDGLKKIRGRFHSSVSANRRQTAALRAWLGARAEA